MTQKSQLAMLLEMIRFSPEHFCSLFEFQKDFFCKPPDISIIEWEPAEPHDRWELEHLYMNRRPMPLEIVNDPRIVIVGIPNDIYLPPNVGKNLDFSCFSSLTTLHLTKTYVREFPSWIRQLPLLNSLSLCILQKRKHPMPTVPEWIHEMPHLTSFSLQGMNLEPIGFHIFDHPHLEYLSLQRCQLFELDGSKSPNTALKELDLSYNELTEFPDISQFKNLEILSLDHNHIKEIPVEIFTHPTLKEIYLNHNEISHVPVFNGEPTPKSISIYDNPITDWAEFIQNTGEALFNVYIKSMPGEWIAYIDFISDKYEYYRHWSPTRIIDMLNQNQEISVKDILHPDFFKYQTFIEEKVVNRQSPAFKDYLKSLFGYSAICRGDDPDSPPPDDLLVLL